VIYWISRGDGAVVLFFLPRGHRNDIAGLLPILEIYRTAFHRAGQASGANAKPTEANEVNEATKAFPSLCSLGFCRNGLPCFVVFAFCPAFASFRLRLLPSSPDYDAASRRDKTARQVRQMEFVLIRAINVKVFLSPSENIMKCFWYSTPK
jgi:hypothetical protein